MEEREILKKIRKLENIKPKREWVVLTKKEILKGEENGVQVLSGFFAPLQRPGFVFLMIVLIGLGLGGFLFFTSFNANKAVQFVFHDNNNNNKEVLASLGDIQEDLKQITSTLENLRESENPSKVLSMTEVIKATANRGEETVKKIKAQSPSKKVLASLVGVEEEFKQLGESSYAIQKEMIKSCIEDFEGRILTEGDQERLKKAEQCLNEGKESEAIILLERIGNNINNQ